MQVITEADSNSINYEVARHVDCQRTIISDEYSDNLRLKEVVKRHRAFVILMAQADKVLPRVHKAIANFKRVFLDA